jgi:hypothetical protein
MLTDQHIAEDLSRAYVQAVAAKAGVNLSTRVHDYGVDGTFHPIRIIGGRRVEAGFPLDFQLKASKNWAISEDHVVYDLEAKTYNDLVVRKRASGAALCILILLCLPENPQEWLDLDEERLLLRKCCYWEYLKGDPSENTQTVRIRIPTAQRLSPESLLALLERVKGGDLQ